MNNIFLTLLLFSLILPVYRLVKGPSSFDRVLSLDAINIIVTGLIVLLSFAYDNKMFMDIAIVYSILSFLEVITFAKYMEGRE
jgi:multicomponent Na+:H+ antiporter subunit F